MQHSSILCFMLVIIVIQLLYIYKNRRAEHYEPEPESKSDLTAMTEQNLAKLETYKSRLITLKDKLVMKARLVLESKNIDDSNKHINHVREEM